MPVLVNCPSCNGPLRVADELLGRKVRCPACQTIFEAAEPPAPSASRNGGRQDEEVERIDSWKQLDLEMARERDPAPPPPPPPAPPPRSSAPPPPPMPGLRGAIEIDPGPQEEPRRPAPPPDDRRPDERRPEPPREDGDLRPCPGCRRMIHRDSTRCYNCGERLVTTSRGRDDRRDVRDDRDDRRDFRRPAYDERDDHGGPPRRDSEPHRGTTILVLGILSLVCLLGFCFLAPAVIGVVLGVIGWWMGHVDLAKMKAGRMDTEGEGMTQGGWICSIIGTVLNMLCVLACGGWILINALQDMERNQRQQPGGFQGPAKQGNVNPGAPQMKAAGGPPLGVVRPKKMRGMQPMQPVGGPPVAPPEQGKLPDAEPEKP